MQEQKNNNKKILVIEDEEALALSLSTFLRAQGYLALAAYDSLYGVSLAHKEKVDLVILDLGLPAGGGFYVLENLKKSVETNNIPVIVLTARQEKELKDKAYQMGVAVYLNKPFDPPELLAKIKEVLNL